uniref:Reverse transcriptase Ty1/copia-type domain-containing protein n=1 Tax=Physcomitrium patens TaxID=3218 RepID=A0A2K1J9V1_PHYPA|nr:hypothetical protein PHYPA_021416 [Physcomitrium patens]
MEGPPHSCTGSLTKQSATGGADLRDRRRVVISCRKTDWTWYCDVRQGRGHAAAASAQSGCGPSLTCRTSAGRGARRFTCKILLLRHIRVFGLQVYILKNNCIADKLSMRSYKDLLTSSHPITTCWIFKTMLGTNGKPTKLKTTFLNNNLLEPIYMIQPKEFIKPESAHKVCLLQKSLYNLKIEVKKIKPILIYYNNQSIIKSTKNLIYHARSKYIENVLIYMVELFYIPTLE